MPRYLTPAPSPKSAAQISTLPQGEGRKFSLSLRKVAFIVGVMAILAVVLPPIGNGAEQLFSLHMVQHLLLIAVTAPLLAISGVLDGLRRFAIVRMLSEPAPAWLAFVFIFLFWHWPAAFRWAAGNPASQLLEYASILFGALLFWSVALSRQGRLSLGARALFVMTGAVATDLPGVIMVFAPRALCTMPGENAALWGLTPLQDQQIAGMLMWVPANLIFFGIATWLFALWISDTRTPSQVTS
jgi:putative membrane protein